MGQEGYVKLKLIVDEKWPIFSLEKPDNSGYNEIDIPEEEYAEYASIMRQYALLQLKLGILYDHKRADCQERIRKDLFPKCCAEESVIEPSWP
jgi:hypothetical protein